MTIIFAENSRADFLLIKQHCLNLGNQDETVSIGLIKSNHFTEIDSSHYDISWPSFGQALRMLPNASFIILLINQDIDIDLVGNAIDSFNKDASLSFIVAASSFKIDIKECDLKYLIQEILSGQSKLQFIIIKNKFLDFARLLFSQKTESFGFHQFEFLGWSILLDLAYLGLKGNWLRTFTTSPSVVDTSNSTIFFHTELMLEFLKNELLDKVKDFLGQIMDVYISRYQQNLQLRGPQLTSSDSFLDNYCRQSLKVLRDRVEAAMLKTHSKASGSKSSPFFSVILTCYDRPHLANNALWSILNQSFRDFELIIINDGGEAQEHLKSQATGMAIDITYVNKPNGGHSSARNIALSVAKGKYISYLDDDDVYSEIHLQAHYDFLIHNPGVACYSAAEYIQEVLKSGMRLQIGLPSIMSNPYSFERLQVFNYIPINVISHPREVINVAGNFDLTLRTHEDWDFLIRLSRILPFHHIATATAQVRTRLGIADSMMKRRWDNISQDFRTIYSRYSDLNNPRIIEGRRRVLEAGHPTQAHLDIKWQVND